MPKPSKDIQEKAVAHVMEKASQWEAMTESLREKWLGFYELYRNFETRDRLPWQSKLFIPKAFEVVEKIGPRLIAHDPKFLAVPKKAGALQFSSIIQEYLQFVWEEESLSDKMSLWVKSMLIYGTAFAKIDWKMRTKTKKKKKLTKTEELTIEEETLIDEVPTFEVADIFDILIDPRETSIQDAFGLIHKIDNVLKENLDTDVYFNLDEIEENEIDDDKKQKHVERGVMDMDTDYISLKEYWGYFDAGKGLKEYVITIANGGTLVRFEENPFITDNRPRGLRPFVAIYDQPVPNEFYGIGEIEPIESLQIEINTLRNQRMDNVNLGINQIWRVDPDSGINPSQVVSAPGQLIFARAGEIEPLFNRDVPVSSYNEEAAINRDIQTTTGTIDFTQEGGRSSFTNTATGERIRANEANSRYQYKLNNVESGIAQVGKIMIRMAGVLADENIVIRRLTEEGDVKFADVNASVFEIAAEGIDIRVDSGSTGFDTIEDKRNNAIALGNISLQYASAGAPVNLVKNFTDILKFFPGVRNPQSHILSPEEQTPTEAVEPGVPGTPPQTTEPIKGIAPVNQFQ